MDLAALLVDFEKRPLSSFQPEEEIIFEKETTLFEDKISLDEAWNAGHLDENFQTSKWGSDEEAEERRRNLRNELDSAHYFLKLCRNNVG